MAPLLSMHGIDKRFAGIPALRAAELVVEKGEVHALIGQNGAGKSTLIKIFAGVHRHDAGEFLLQGEPVSFASPREALDAGIATVYQDLAVVKLMPVWRNFFLGSELRRGRGPLARLDTDAMRKIAKAELLAMGIDLRDIDQPIGTLSGGERQCVAIARAVYFGAKVLILDEPTSALGVKQASIVLRYIAQTREQGLGVIFITHNIHHAYPIGDRFTVLNHGRSLGVFDKGEVSMGELEKLMAGGAELEELEAELQGGTQPEQEAPANEGGGPELR